MAKPFLLLVAAWFLAAVTSAASPVEKIPPASGMLPAFVSLSVELSGFSEFGGNKVFKNRLTKHLIKHLSDAQFAPIGIRIGGKSADRAIFDENRRAHTPKRCGKKFPDKTSYCLGPSFFHGHGAMRPKHTVLSHNFNLASFNSSGRYTLNGTGSIVMCKYLHDETQVVEMGNEPDLYPASHRRPSSYSVERYIAEWRSMRHLLDRFVREACPDVSAKSFVKYMYPSLSSTRSQFDLAALLAGLNKEDAHRIDQVSVHHTMGRALDPGVTMEGVLMNHTAVVQAVQTHVDFAREKLGDFPAPYVIGQLDSLDDGGVEGLTDTFGSALWAMDFALAAAASGVIKRLYFHLDIRSASAAWRPIRPLKTAPAFYGLFAAATFLANSSRLAVSEFDVERSAPGDRIIGYRAFQDGKLARVAILNLNPYENPRPFDPPLFRHQGKNPRPRRRLFVDVGMPESRWQVMRLSGPGAHATEFITFEGRHYSPDVIGMKNGAGAPVPGRNYDEAVWANDAGLVEILVADTEAVVLIIPEDL
ncbi:hypothetical protein E4U53_003157 [Claviceps sorghi]|nr:hypothetical protein E4U53_003157 [Claviceps sorghi]